MSNQIFIPAFEGGDGGIIEKAYTLPQLRDAMDFCISMVTASTAASIGINVKGRGKLVIEQYNGSAYSTTEYWMTERLTFITITLSKGKNIKLYGCVTTFGAIAIQLTALDVSKNTALTSLSCRGNELTTLDVSHNPSLTILDCYLNQLTSLKLPIFGEHEVEQINVTYNPIVASVEAAKAWLDSLPYQPVPYDDYYKDIYIGELADEIGEDYIKDKNYAVYEEY